MKLQELKNPSEEPGVSLENKTTTKYWEDRNYSERSTVVDVDNRPATQYVRHYLGPRDPKEFNRILNRKKK